MLTTAWILVAALDFNTAVADMERAVIEGDQPTLQRIAEEFREAIDNQDELPGADARLPYAYAYVSWRLSAFHERGSDPAKDRLKDAEKVLKRILKEDPNHAEAQALYGTVNGGLITSMWSGMRRGPRANKAYERARQAAPENPRVAMHEGTSRLFRPGAFGGGIDKAEAELRQALELFDEEPKDEPWPYGGHAEVRAWLGKVMVEKGDLAKALEYYDEALELEPDYHWVREELLPELDAAKSEASQQMH